MDHPTLGIIRLDYDYPTALGDIDNPYSFGYPVIYRVVPGLTFQMAQSGHLTPEVEHQFELAIHYLAEERRVSAITGDCGFMMWFEEKARSLTRTPCSLSALMQLPAISSTLSKTRDHILIVTANVTSLNPMRGLINQVTGSREEQGHLVYVGLEDVPHFGEEVELGMKVDVQRAEPGILAKIDEALHMFPDTCAILLECTELPPYAAAVRAATGLPVYDAITNCNFVMNAFLEDGNIGHRGFYKQWDGRQESYRFGKNLTRSQRGNLVSAKDKLDASFRAPDYHTPLWDTTGTDYNQDDYLHLTYEHTDSHDQQHASHSHYGFIEVLGKQHELLKDANGHLFYHDGHYAYEAYIHFVGTAQLEAVPLHEYEHWVTHVAEAGGTLSTIYIVDDYTHYFESWSAATDQHAAAFQYNVYFNPVSGFIYGHSEGTDGPDDVVVDGHHLHYVGRNTYQEDDHYYHVDQSRQFVPENHPATTAGTGGHHYHTSQTPAGKSNKKNNPKLMRRRRRKRLLANAGN